MLRLLWESWEHSRLVKLLKPVGNVIRVDQTTLLCLEGKFAQVCLNIDVMKPLSWSLVISYQGRSMKIPLIYEGLHEVCVLCGFDSHQVKACPNLPSQSNIEIAVEKFGETKVKSSANPGPLSSSKEPVITADQWI